METKFNSQICTSCSQSERLLKLGLKKETADMTIQDDGWYVNAEPFCEWEDDRNTFPSLEEPVPAWSLHRLIEMMPSIFKDHIEEAPYHLSIDGNRVFYENRLFCLCQFFGGDLYTSIIICIEWLIKEGYFNEEYLCQE